MTKEYESIYRGNIREICDLLKNNEIKLFGSEVNLINKNLHFFYFKALTDSQSVPIPQLPSQIGPRWGTGSGAFSGFLGHASRYPSFFTSLMVKI